MPRKSHFTKEQIIEVAIDIVRKSGHEALSARTICEALGCSVAPLFLQSTIAWMKSSMTLERR